MIRQQYTQRMEVRDYSSHHNSLAIIQGHFGHHPKWKARIKQRYDNRRVDINRLNSNSNCQQYPRKYIFQVKIKDQNICKTYETILGLGGRSVVRHLPQTYSPVFNPQHHHTDSALKTEDSIFPCCKKNISLTILKALTKRSNKSLYKSVT